MTQSHLPNKITVIGGGLTGLALGQALKEANIPFRIYERDTNAGFRAQGYRIRIGPDGAGALQHLLPDKLWMAFKATCAAVIPGGNRLDARTGEPAQWNRGPPPAHTGNNSKWALPDDHVFNADRAVLRDVLLSGLEEHVEFGKRFERYELVVHGGVIAHFTDGTSVNGSLLVGADGIRSTVRRQLFPDFGLLDTEGRAVFGKTVINNELTSRTAEEIGRGINIAADNEESRAKLFTDSMRFDRHKSEEALSEDGFEIPEDYIYWVFLFRNDLIANQDDQSLRSSSNERSAQLSMDLSQGWSDKIRVLFEMQKVEATSALAFLTAPPDLESNWTKKPQDTRARVVLMGDSAHPMPPVGGVGANAGFQDAADLFTALKSLETATTQMDCERLVSEFEHAVLGRAKLAVEQSSRGAGMFFGMRPVTELKVVALSH